MGLVKTNKRGYRVYGGYVMTAQNSNDWQERPQRVLLLTFDKGGQKYIKKLIKKVADCKVNVLLLHTFIVPIAFQL